jgi:small subunit ribosomal protein S20
MATTKTAAKRARQAVRRNECNQIVRSGAKTFLKAALEAIESRDVTQAKTAYKAAVRTLSKAASKGAIPARRAARKVSRLTLLAKKALPAMLD